MSRDQDTVGCLLYKVYLTIFAEFTHDFTFRFTVALPESSLFSLITLLTNGKIHLHSPIIFYPAKVCLFLKKTLRIILLELVKTFEVFLNLWFWSLKPQPSFNPSKWRTQGEKQWRSNREAWLSWCGIAVQIYLVRIYDS